MKKIAIIGANDFQNPLILKAKQLGYETHVFAWKDGAVGEKTADYFYPISITQKDEILEKCKQIKIDAIATIASDLATLTVNYVANKLNLPGNSLECTQKATNKYKMRQAFKNSKISTPGFEIVKNEEDLEKIKYMQYPLIVKPTDRSGSRAITKVYKDEELFEAVSRAIENSFESKAIVEEYIEGQEYSAEGITFNGKHQFLTITKKYTTGVPNFIETGHIEPADLPKELENKIYNELSNALTSLEITNSATHSEFKITPQGEMKIIEIGARMGGDCIGSDLVQISTGYDYIKMVIDVATGNKPEFKKVTEPKISAIKFIFNQEDLEKCKKLEKIHSESIYRISKIEKIGTHKVIDSSSRYGYYIIRANNKEEIRWLFDE